MKIDEIAVPTRYFEEASSVGFKRSVVYGLSTLRVVGALPAPPDRAPPLGEAPPAPLRERAPSRLTMRFRGGLGPGGPRGRHLAGRPRAGRPDRSTSRRPGRRSRPRTRRGSRCCSCSSAIDIAAAGRALAGAARRRSRAVPFLTTLASLLVGYLANNVLPARLGEVVRSHDLGTRTGRQPLDDPRDDRHRAGRGHDGRGHDRGRGDPRAVRPRDRGLGGAGRVRADRAARAWASRIGIYAHRLPGAERVRAYLDRWPRVRHVLVRLRDGLPWRSNLRAMGIADRPVARVVVVHGAGVRGGGPGGGRGADDRPGGAARRRDQPRDRDPGRARLRGHVGAGDASRSRRPWGSTAAPALAFAMLVHVVTLADDRASAARWCCSLDRGAGAARRGRGARGDRGPPGPVVAAEHAGRGGSGTAGPD